MKTVQVFDWTEMSSPLDEKVSCYFEASNDTYHRYYPNGGLRKYNPDFYQELNAWLLEQGMVPEEGEYFYVLIHISW